MCRIAANAEKRMQTQQKVKTALDAGQKVAETRKKAIQSKMDENEQRLAALARQHAARLPQRTSPPTTHAVAAPVCVSPA